MRRLFMAMAGGPSAKAVSWAALLTSIAALVFAATGPAVSKTVTIGGGGGSGHGGGKSGGGGGKSGGGSHKGSGRVLRLGKNGKIPASVIPASVKPSCLPTTVDLGTWCLMSAPYPLTNQQVGQNDFFFASRTCASLGGWLPSAAELLGAASRVQLESVINDSPLTATIQQDPSLGLKDQREMSSTLVTTAAGSDAAGSEGVSVGSTGNPRLGEPNPVPQPAVPEPQTLQYVTVYDNFDKGGFAGSEPVSKPENFRCAFAKSPGAAGRSTK